MASKALLAATEPRIIVPENKQIGILNWDVDNNYPARMRVIVGNSVTASNCLKVYERFVFANGYTDETFAKTKVNDNGDTADKVLRLMVKDKGFINGIAVHINYNAAFEKVSVTALSIDSVRLDIAKEKAAIHPNWEKRKDKGPFKKSDIDFIDLYDPSPEVIAKQIEEAGGIENYKGQVFFWSPFGLSYPTAQWDSAAEDMQTEAGTKIFRHRTVGQNFMPSQYIIVDDLESEDPQTSGNPDGSRTKQEESFADIITNTVKQFQSPENAASVMVIQKPSPETTFQMEVPDLQHFDGMYEKTEKSTDAAILRGFMIPRPLILEGGDSLFSSGEVLRAAAEFYNGITNDDRLELAEISREIFSNWESDINLSEDYSINSLTFKKEISVEYFPYFTKNEIRESLGASPAEESDADKKMLVETIGVGGTTSLVTILTNPELNYDQKKGTLKVLFNFTDDEILLVLGAPPLTSQA